jgi:7-cyano-7-deazaguanine synthase
MSKVVILLSGGIDSTTCLAQAVNSGKNEIYALNITYGQKHIRELRSAEAVAAYYDVPYKLLDLSCVFTESSCSLLSHSAEKIEHASYAQQLKNLEKGKSIGTYVPFRNGLMLSAAASYAQSIGASRIIYGAHADDAAGRAYPDCTPEFVKYMNLAIKEGTGDAVTIDAPFISCRKTEIVACGLKLNVPYHLTWSCYEGGEHPCGTCGTCRDRIKAFENNNAVDPLHYPQS